MTDHRTTWDTYATAWRAATAAEKLTALADRLEAALAATSAEP